MDLNVPRLYELFLQDRQFLKNCRPKTIRSYRQAWNAFSAHLAGVARADQFRPALKQAVMAKMSEGRLKPSAINVYIRPMNAFVKWLANEEYIPSPIKPLELLKTTKRPIPTLTSQQISRLVSWRPKDVVDRRTHTMALVILDCGLRLDECLSLEQGDVDLENFLLTVQHGKGDKERKVPLSANGRALLFQYMRKHPNDVSSLIFATRTGTKISERNAERDLGALAKALQVPMRWHLLRHTFGTEFIRNGGNVADLKRILGHASITTTMLYVHNQSSDFVQKHNGYSPLSKAMRR